MHLGDQLGGDAAQVDFRIHQHGFLQGLVVQRPVGDFGEAGLQAGEVVRLDGEAGGGGVPAVPHQQIGALVEGAGDVEFRDAAPGAFGDARSSPRHQRGTVKLVGQARGNQPDHPFVEAGVGDEVEGRQLPVFQYLAARLFHKLPGHVLPFGVDVSQFLGQLACLPRVAGGEEAVGEAGVRQPSGGVEARAEDEADAAGRDVARRKVAFLNEGVQSHAPGLVDLAQPALHQRAIFAQQRDHVGDGANGNQVEEGIILQGGDGGALRGNGLSQCLHQFEGHAHARQLAEGVLVIGAFGVDDRRRRGEHVVPRRVGGDVVVVGDDELQAQAVAVSHFFHGADAAVHRDNQRRPLLCQRGDGFLVQPVPLVKAVGDVGANVGAQSLKRLHHQHGGGDAVGIVIPIDHNRRVVLNGRQEVRHRFGHVFEEIGVVRLLALQKGMHFIGAVNAPVVQKLYHQTGNVGELGEVSFGCAGEDFPACGRCGHGNGSTGLIRGVL